MVRGEASPLFGNPRGDALNGVLGNVEQTMFGEPLYRTREEKALVLSLRSKTGRWTGHMKDVRVPASRYGFPAIATPRDSL